jgi:predicted RNA methylase
VKLRHELSAQKLRGGYYTPPDVVDFCLSRALASTRGPVVRWLEPGAGDGAFMRGLAARSERRAATVTCIEIDPREAAKCRRGMAAHGIRGDVIEDSFFRWLAVPRTQARQFDVVVGNPPYVRYQFVARSDREAIAGLAAESRLEIQGVSNAWIPFALFALMRLRVGGGFALVLPSELIYTVSAGEFRRTLASHFVSVRVDFFARGTFADILQDVVVVSGRRATMTDSGRAVTFVEHGPAERRWSWHVPASADSWARFLLSQRESAALETAQALPDVRRFSEIARMQVAVVTGANSFFTVSDDVVARYALEPWIVPLLPRTAHAPGLRFTDLDFEAARRCGVRTWLLDFASARPRPDRKGVREYLATGEALGIPARYKCRIRDPWYRVPHIECGTLMLTKRAHRHHRLLLNDAGVHTTDTVYRGRALESHRERDVVAAFHNSLTLLSSELEGRTYGGGVLELVPSEIARLRVPVVRGFGEHLGELDATSRAHEGQRDPEDRLAALTDAKLAAALPGYAKLLPELHDARVRLRYRRFGVDAPS